VEQSKHSPNQTYVTICDAAEPPGIGVRRASEKGRAKKPLRTLKIQAERLVELDAAA
jgi:hypothetical protein